MKQEVLAGVHRGVKNAVKELTNWSKADALTPAGSKCVLRAYTALHEPQQSIVCKETAGRQLYKEVTFITNQLTSIFSGVRDREIDAATVGAMRSRVLARLKELESSTALTLDASVLRSDNDTVEVRSMSEDERLTQEVHDAMQFNVKQIPKAGSKRFVVLRLPVIPLFDPIVSLASLKKAGFDVKQIGLYPVLQNELVIAVPENFSGTAKKLPPLKRGLRIIVAQDNARDAFWFGTVEKARGTEVVVHFDAGDEDTVSKANVVAVLDDSKIKPRQKVGVTVPLDFDSVNEYAQKGSSSVHVPDKVAERVLASAQDKPGGQYLDFVECEHTFVKNRKIPNYRFYWVTDSRSISRLQSQTKVIITDWNLSV